MGKIDLRKIVSFGKGSYIVSMPKKWIEKNKLKKGDLVALNDNGVELVLSPNASEQKPDAKEIEIDAKGKDLERLSTEIVTSYLNCYDSITIIFEKSNDARKIKDILRNLSGMEIMEQTSTKIVAKNLISTSEISIKNIIRRMDVITKAMIDDVVLCYRGQDLSESIHHRDSDINRIYFLSYRVIKNAMKNPRIAKLFETDSWELHSDSLMIMRLEKIADRQKRISRFLISAHLDRKTLAELDSIHTSMAEAYNEVMKSFYSKDKEILFNVEISTKERTQMCDIFLERYLGKCGDKNVDIVAVSKIIENLKAMAVETRNLARTALCYQ